MQLSLFILSFLLGVLAPPPDEDKLGDIVVEAIEPDAHGPRLMRLALAPVEGEGSMVSMVDKVLRRDLDLSGQFVVLDIVDGKVPASAEAILRVSMSRSGAGRAKLSAEIYFDAEATVPAYEKQRESSLTALRRTVHFTVDDVMGTLTGYRGPFASRFAFVARRGDTRSVYIVDADGYGLRRVTTDELLVSTTAMSPQGVLYYAASKDHGRYKLYRDGQSEPLQLDPRGSVYGLAFAPDGSRVAMTIATGRDVRLFTGPSDFSQLERTGRLPLALSPAVSTEGAVAVAGTAKIRPRIWVDGRPASPRGANAAAPDFCAHPDGTKLVYALGGRNTSNLVVANPRGRGARRITRGGGRHSHPACSPDGRLVAFFSSRRSGEGPGLYVIRVDGYHLRKVADVRGDSLHWARLPEPMNRG